LHKEAAKHADNVDADKGETLEEFAEALLVDGQSPVGQSPDKDGALDRVVPASESAYASFMAVRNDLQPAERHQDRLKLRDLRTQKMSFNEYLEFTKARDKGLKKSKAQFIEWFSSCSSTVCSSIGQASQNVDRYIPKDLLPYLIFILQDRVSTIVETGLRILHSATSLGQPGRNSVPTEAVRAVLSKVQKCDTPQIDTALPPLSALLYDDCRSLTAPAYRCSVSLLYELIDRPMFNIQGSCLAACRPLKIIFDAA